MANQHISRQNLKASLVAFETKLQILLNEQARLKWEIEELKEKNKALREENTRFKTEYQETKKKHRQLEKDFNRSRFFAKIVTNKLTPTGGVSELKEVIDHYIQSIDAVIAKLKQTL